MPSRYWILELNSGFVALSNNLQIIRSEESYIGRSYSS